MDLAAPQVQRAVGLYRLSIARAPAGGQGGEWENTSEHRQGHCCGSVIPSWKERVSELNLRASDFLDVSGSPALSPACLFTRLPGQEQKDMQGDALQWDTERKQMAKPKPLTCCPHASSCANYNLLNTGHVFIACFDFKMYFKMFLFFHKEYHLENAQNAKGKRADL